MSRANRAWAFALIIAAAAVSFGSLALASQLSSSGVAEADLSCVEKAAGFEDYALVFAGEEFNGLPLRGCHRVTTPERYNVDGTVREPAMDFFVFTYGDCTPAVNESSCARPLQIFVDPRCGPKLHESIKAEKVAIRGLDVAVKLDGSIRIETDTYGLSVFALAGDYDQSKKAALGVAASLRGANPLAANLTVDTPMGNPAVVSIPTESKDPCTSGR